MVETTTCMSRYAVSEQGLTSGGERSTLILLRLVRAVIVHK
jgi:hypothetical protein